MTGTSTAERMQSPFGAAVGERAERGLGEIEDGRA
jgi:hypothetical protein